MSVSFVEPNIDKLRKQLQQQQQQLPLLDSSAIDDQAPPASSVKLAKAASAPVPAARSLSAGLLPGSPGSSTPLRSVSPAGGPPIKPLARQSTYEATLSNTASNSLLFRRRSEDSTANGIGSSPDGSPQGGRSRNSSRKRSSSRRRISAANSRSNSMNRAHSARDDAPASAASVSSALSGLKKMGKSLSVGQIPRSSSSKRSSSAASSRDARVLDSVAGRLAADNESAIDDDDDDTDDDNEIANGAIVHNTTTASHTTDSEVLEDTPFFKRVAFDTINVSYYNPPTSHNWFRPSFSTALMAAAAVSAAGAHTASLAGIGGDGADGGLNDEPYHSFSVSSKHEDFCPSYGSRTFLCALSSVSTSRKALQWLVEHIMEDGDELLCLKVQKETNPKDGVEYYRSHAEELLTSIIHTVVDSSVKKINVIVELSIGSVKHIVRQAMLLYQPAIVIVGTSIKQYQNVMRYMSKKNTLSNFLINHSPVPVIVVVQEMLDKKANLVEPRNEKLADLSPLFEAKGGSPEQPTAAAAFSTTSIGTAPLTPTITVTSSDKETNQVLGASKQEATPLTTSKSAPAFSSAPTPPEHDDDDEHDKPTGYFPPEQTEEVDDGKTVGYGIRRRSSASTTLGAFGYLTYLTSRPNFENEYDDEPDMRQNYKSLFDDAPTTTTTAAPTPGGQLLRIPTFDGNTPKLTSPNVTGGTSTTVSDSYSMNVTPRPYTGASSSVGREKRDEVDSDGDEGYDPVVPMKSDGWAAAKGRSLSRSTSAGSPGPALLAVHTNASAKSNASTFSRGRSAGSAYSESSSRSKSRDSKYSSKDDGVKKKKSFLSFMRRKSSTSED